MSIQSDDTNAPTSFNDDAAEAALMASFDGEPKDAKVTPEAPADDDDDAAAQSDPQDDEDDNAADPQDDDAQDPEDPAETPEAKAAKTALEINDDHELTFSVDGEDHKVTVGSLKRLAGQEASLTRKSQEADLVGARAAAALQAAISTVGEDLKPYANVDWMVLQSETDPETFKWHRENAARLEAQFNKLIGAAEGVETTFKARKTAVDAEAKAEGLKELKADIPEWSDAHHADILKYAAGEGLDADELATITNPKVLKLLRKAMLHDKAGAIVTQKVKAAPAKVIPGSSGTQPSAKAAVAAKAMTRLSKTGSSDDAMAALMGRWK